MSLSSAYIKNRKIKVFFLPGSEWIYFKIYLHESFSNTLLEEVWKSVIRPLLKSNEVEKCFFIRYADPEFHIRLRFLIHENSDCGMVLRKISSFLEKQIRSRKIHKVSIDTYEREIERYGKSTIEIAESIFCYDSLFCIKKLSEISTKHEDDGKYMTALRHMNFYCDAFELSLPEKTDFAHRMSLLYKREYNFNAYNSKSLNTIYRSKKELVQKSLRQENDKGLLKSAEEKKISTLIKLIIKETKQKENYLNSYIHMFVNRFFMGKNRLHEMVLYDLLFRYYSSQQARIKSQK